MRLGQDRQWWIIQGLIGLVRTVDFILTALGHLLQEAFC